MTRNDALQIFSRGFENFRKRKSLTLDEVGKILGCGRANVFKIKSGSNFPSVEGIFTLVENGMRLEEIFGSDLAQKLTEGLEPVIIDGKPDAFDTPEFRQGVADAIAALMSKGLQK